MSTGSDYTSGSYSDRLQVQLDLNVVSQLSDGRGSTTTTRRDWRTTDSATTRLSQQNELKYLMKKYNVPMSSRNFSRKYGRKTKKRTGYSRKK